MLVRWLGLPRGKLVRLGLGRFSLRRGEGGLPHVPKSRLDLRPRRLLELVLIGPTAGSACRRLELRSRGSRGLRALPGGRSVALSRALDTIGSA